MRFLAHVIGVLMILMGLLWMGQGAGIVHWPQSSFMLDQRPWMWRGLLLAAVGVTLILLALRRKH